MPTVYLIKCGGMVFYVISKLPKEEVERMANEDLRTFQYTIKTSPHISYYRDLEYVI